MHRSISLASCFAALMMLAGAIPAHAMPADHPIVMAAASGGISGTGGYSDTGENGTTSGSAAGDVNDTMKATNTPTNATAIAPSRTHSHPPQSSSGNPSNSNRNYGPGSTNGSSKGNGAYNGPNGTSGVSQ